MRFDHLGHYRVLDKLGAGGMGEVYLAEDARLGRKVAIKILPERTAKHPERLARFRREAKMVAALNHPNIVTLYSVEEADGVHFLTMEYIEGRALSTLLRSEGMPLPELLSIAKPLVDAVDTAHQHGITHRDLKPDNVMLTATGRVKVLDFGLAKPVDTSGPISDESVTSAELGTQEGQILGTASYMSPEQAEGRSVDHRSDIFSLGVLLYEMASGFRPFRGESKLAILSSILRDAPRPLDDVRRDLPPELAKIVARCLEKLPERRYQSARDLYHDLVGLEGAGSSVSSAPHPAAVRSPLSDADARAHDPSDAWSRIQRAQVLRVVGLYALCAAVALLVSRYLVERAGLPDWVFPGTIVLLAIGLPILVTTAFLQSAAFLRSDLGSDPSARGPAAAISSPRRLFTWKRAIGGGVLAFLGFGLLVGGYVVSRRAGIGPFASLVSSGALAAQDRILIAEFENQTQDPTLASTVREALAIDLAQSTTVQVVPTQRVVEVLALMERPADSPLDVDLARELAERDGIKAIVAGQIHPAGNGYVLTARLVAPGTDEVLGAYRSTADGPGALIAAIDKLSGSIREDIGESLRSIRANPPLDRVTTHSLEALRKYSQAVREAEVAGDQSRAVELLQEATAIDTTFAMAYRKLGTVLSNTFQRRAEALDAIRRAYRHRGRLPERERLFTEATYVANIEDDTDQVIRIYERILELNPNDSSALNNLGVMHSRKGDPATALQCYQRAQVIAPNALQLGNILSMEVSLGRFSDAESTLALFQRSFPEHPQAVGSEVTLASARFDYARAMEAADRFVERARGRGFAETQAHWWRGGVFSVQGRLREAEASWAEAATASVRIGNRTAPIELALDLAFLDLYVRQDPARALERLDRTLQSHPLAALPAEERWYLGYAVTYAGAGNVRRAREFLDLAKQNPVGEANIDNDLRFAEGTVALAENRPRDAVRAFQELLESAPDAGDGLPFLGLAYEAIERPDSAQYTYERYLTMSDLTRLLWDRHLLAFTLQRLASVYEQRGERDRALQTHRRLTELWKNADPELRDRVARSERAMARLASERG